MNYQALAQHMAKKKDDKPGYSGRHGGINPINKATGQRRYSMPYPKMK